MKININCYYCIIISYFILEPCLVKNPCLKQWLKEFAGGMSCGASNNDDKKADAEVVFICTSG